MNERGSQTVYFIEAYHIGTERVPAYTVALDNGDVSDLNAGNAPILSSDDLVHFIEELYRQRILNAKARDDLLAEVADLWTPTQQHRKESPRALKPDQNPEDDFEFVYPGYFENWPY